MCYQIAVFIFSMLCLICQIGFNPLVFRMFPTSTKEPKVDWASKQMPGIFTAAWLYQGNSLSKLTALNLQEMLSTVRSCVSFQGHMSSGK